MEEILHQVADTHPGLVQNTNWGEVGLFYNPENKLKKGIYLLTIKERDGANDQASSLDRENVYRLNLGITKETFLKMFNTIPARPNAGGVVNMDYDFSEIDKIMPHPVYGWMSWICVLNPSVNTFEKLKPLIEEGYQLALKKYAKKVK